MFTIFLSMVLLIAIALGVYRMILCPMQDIKPTKKSIMAYAGIGFGLAVITMLVAPFTEVLQFKISAIRWLVWALVAYWGLLIVDPFHRDYYVSTTRYWKWGIAIVILLFNLAFPHFVGTMVMLTLALAHGLMSWDWSWFAFLPSFSISWETTGWWVLVSCAILPIIIIILNSGTTNKATKAVVVLFTGILIGFFGPTVYETISSNGELLFESSKPAGHDHDYERYQKLEENLDSIKRVNNYDPNWFENELDSASLAGADTTALLEVYDQLEYFSVAIDSVTYIRYEHKVDSALKAKGWKQSTGKRVETTIHYYLETK